MPSPPPSYSTSPANRQSEEPPAPHFLFLLRLLTEEPVPARKFYLEAGAYAIGSLPESDVPIPAKGVSRRHARLDVTNDGFATITDLGSRNGTFCNGRRIESAEVPPHTLFSIGSVSAELVPVDGHSRGQVEAQVAASESGATRIAAPARPHASHTVEERTAIAAGVVLGLVASGALGREEAALRLTHEWLAILPAQRFEWLAPDDESNDGAAGSSFVLAASSRSSAASGQRLVYRSPSGMRLHVWSDDAAVFDRCAPVFILILEALALARAPEPADRGAQGARLALELPAPGSVDQALIESYRQAAKVAAGDLHVLLCGASGTGKRLLARWIHERSPRAAKPFLAVYCGGQDPEVLEAELFGRERETPRGPQVRAGVLERADGGTVYLDAVAELTPALQGSILRVIEDRTFHRVGGNHTIATDVRFLAGTERDLDALEGGDGLRTDLFYRLAGFSLRLPTLAQRRADVPILGAHFFHSETERHGKSTAGISRSALAALVTYSWPGNVRELQNEIAKAVLLLESGEPLELRHLSARVRGEAVQDPARALTLDGSLRRAEREAFEVALAAAGGDDGKAMALLELPRTTYERRLQALGLRRAGTS